MVLRFPHILFAVITLGVVPTLAGISVHAGGKIGSLVPASPMLEGRSGHTATLLPDGRVLLAGGMRRNLEFYKSAELYDPVTKRFQATGAMNLARVGHAAVPLRSGKVLIVGGWIGHECTDSAELYDPSTGKFTMIAKMGSRRGQPTATLLSNGDVLIAGGADHDTPGGIASAEIFHADTLRFEPVGSMHYPRVSHTATLLNDGRVLIAGGRGESVTPTAELYDPLTKTFLQTGSMRTARYKHTAGLLPDGKVLVAGGSDDRDWQGLTNSAEIYDPDTEKFFATSPLNDKRFKLPEESVQLPTGRILVAGGSKRVEIYDRNAKSFLLAAGEMSDDWHFMTATLLKDGTALLTGGYANNDLGTNQTWIYRP
jgi:hypothetical protein